MGEAKYIKYGFPKEGKYLVLARPAGCGDNYDICEWFNHDPKFSRLERPDEGNYRNGLTDIDYLDDLEEWISVVREAKHSQGRGFYWFDYESCQYYLEENVVCYWDLPRIDGEANSEGV